MICPDRLVSAVRSWGYQESKWSWWLIIVTRTVCVIIVVMSVFPKEPCKVDSALGYLKAQPGLEDWKKSHRSTVLLRKRFAADLRAPEVPAAQGSGRSNDQSVVLLSGRARPVPAQRTIAHVAKMH